MSSCVEATEVGEESAVACEKSAIPLAHLPVQFNNRYYCAVCAVLLVWYMVGYYVKYFDR